MDIADTLRKMADGRMLLNVRHGIATPAGLLAKAADEIERLRGHLKWFCERVDAGEVRSKRTYARFKSELDGPDEQIATGGKDG